MSDEKKLSDRVRPNIEAAPWVCDEIAALEQRLAEAGWQPIETAPKDNKRPLYLAQFDEKGTLIDIDFDCTWESEIESWEAPNRYYYWASAHGNIEEPTHWAYQDAGAPPQENTHD